MTSGADHRRTVSALGIQNGTHFVILEHRWCTSNPSYRSALLIVLSFFPDTNIFLSWFCRDMHLIRKQQADAGAPSKEKVTAGIKITIMTEDDRQGIDVPCVEVDTIASVRIVVLPCVLFKHLSSVVS